MGSSWNNQEGHKNTLGQDHGMLEGARTTLKPGNKTSQERTLLLPPELNKHAVLAISCLEFLKTLNGILLHLYISSSQFRIWARTSDGSNLGHMFMLQLQRRCKVKPGVFSICTESQTLPPLETLELRNHPFVKGSRCPIARDRETGPSKRALQLLFCKQSRLK